MSGSLLRRGSAFAAALLLCVGSVAAAAERPRDDDTRLTLSSGLDYSTGNYGASSSTGILFAPMSVRLRSGNFRWSANAAWLRVDGPGDIVAGTDGTVIVAPGGSARRTNSGIGDMSLGSSYAFKPATDLEIELGVRTKIPTASDIKGLGTGKLDASVSVDVSYWTGKLLPFAGVKWMLRGDPSAYRLNDGLDASVGVAARVGHGVDVFASYEYSQASSAFSGDEHSLFAGATIPLSDHWRLTPYGIAGLSRFAPSVEVGLQIGWRIN